MENKSSKGGNIDIEAIVIGHAKASDAQASGAPGDQPSGGDRENSQGPAPAGVPIGSPVARQIVEQLLQGGERIFIEACIRKAEAEGLDVGSVRAKAAAALPSGEARASIVENGAASIEKRISLASLGPEALLGLGLAIAGLNCSLVFMDIKGNKPAPDEPVAG